MFKEMKDPSVTAETGSAPELPVTVKSAASGAGVGEANGLIEQFAMVSVM
jgi:hypothetical protein